MKHMRQAGAIPFRRRGEDDLEFLIITSLKGNWIFPKGIVEPGETAEETAAKECLEEAGVRGRLLQPPVGTYQDQKWNRECSVELYLLEVDEHVEPWDERLVRERRWCTYREAKQRLKKRRVRELLRQARDRLREKPPADADSA